MLHRSAVGVLVQTRGPARNPCIAGKTEGAGGMPTSTPLPSHLILLTRDRDGSQEEWLRLNQLLSFGNVAP